MGIDVYLAWDGMTEKQDDAQITGWSPYAGHKGYLREAYHGNIYATKVLISEDWDSQPYVEDAPCPARPGCGFTIPNKTLVERLPKTLETVALRERVQYSSGPKDIAKTQKSYTDFVALHGKKEKAGKNPRIIVSY